METPIQKKYDRINLAVAYCTGDLVHADTTLCLNALSYQNVVLGSLNQVPSRASLIQKGRHLAVVKALESRMDKLLFIDSDMTFPYDTALRLLDSKKSIVGCTYSRRRAPHVPTAKYEDKNWVYPKKGGGVVEVHRIGTGVLLVDMRVFQNMKPPYFNTGWGPNGFIGEDTMFCSKAQKMGYKIHCDLDLSLTIGHIGTKTYYLREKEGE